MRWVSMAEQPPTSLRAPGVLLSVLWSGVGAIGGGSSGNMFSRVMNQVSPSGSPTDESGFDICQENANCPNA